MNKNLAIYYLNGEKYQKNKQNERQEKCKKGRFHTLYENIRQKQTNYSRDNFISGTFTSFKVLKKTFNVID